MNRSRRPGRSRRWAGGRLAGGLLVLACLPGASLAAGPAGGPPRQLSPLPMSASLVDNRVQVLAPEPAEPVAVELRAADGTLRAAAEASAPGPPGAWTARLLDPAGEPVVPRSGDVLTARQGAGEAHFTLPMLGLRFDREADAIQGRTAAEVAGVEVVVGNAAGLRWAEARPDAQGGWRVGWADFDVMGGQPITVTARVAAGHRLTLPRRVPMVRVSYHPGDVTGLAAPFGVVSATLRGPDGAELGSARALADAAGRYNLWLRDRHGRVLRPDPGMRLTIGDTDDLQTLTLGQLTGTWDLPGNRLWGAGEPGAMIDLTVWNPWFPGESDYPRVQVDDRGRWQLALAVPLHPGSHFYLLAQAPEGDALYYCQQVPLLRVQPGSPVVAVETLWEVTAELTLEREGAPVAGARGGGRWSGSLALVLRDAGGQEVDARPGDRLEAVLDGWWRQALTVPLLTAAVDGPGRRLLGLAAPASAVTLGEGQPMGATVADAAGRWALGAGDRLGDGGVQPGRLFDAYVRTEGDHHARLPFVGATLGLTLGDQVLAGRAMPRAGYTLTRRLADGRSAALQATADALGRFEAVLQPSRQALPPTAPGDEVTLETGGGRLALQVPEVSGRLDPATGILGGTAPPRSLLELAVAIGPDGDHPERLFTYTDELGRWSLTLPDRGRGGPLIDPATVREVAVTWREDARSVTRIVPGPRGPWRARLMLPYAAH